MEKIIVNKRKNDLLILVIGRDEEIYRIIQVLSKTTKNNVLLIGPSVKYFTTLFRLCK